MGPRLSSWGWSPVHRYSKMKIIAGVKRSWALPRGEMNRPRIYHSWDQGDLLNFTGTKRLLGGQKGREHHPVVGDVYYYRPLCSNPFWLRDACVHRGEPWDKLNMDSEPTRQDDWPEEAQKNCCIEVIQTTMRAWLVLSPSVCVCLHVCLVTQTCRAAWASQSFTEIMNSMKTINYNCLDYCCLICF